jgi:DNA-directed RNA polymerase beta subunit
MATTRAGARKETMTDQLKRYFAMLDTEELVEIQTESFNQALDQEPENAHWMFSTESLSKFVNHASALLNARSTTPCL